MSNTRNEMENANLKWRGVLQKREAAVCKPCWELRYCPYGVLVEGFPIPDEGSPKCCRVYGHECPVFHTAEPITETLSKRRVVRSISQATKLKVIRRDKYVCQLCRKDVPDEDVNFDHIIPWSKGGTSDESNIRLLCAECNKKRGASYEDEHLIVSIGETFYKPIKLSVPMLHDLQRLSLLYLRLEELFKSVTVELFCNVLNSGERPIDEFAYELIIDIVSLLRAQKPKQSKKSIQMLRYRWGMVDSSIHSVIDTCLKHRIEMNEYISEEVLLMRRLGFYLEEKHRRSKNYLEYSIDASSSRKKSDELIADYSSRISHEE